MLLPNVWSKHWKLRLKWGTPPPSDVLHLCKMRMDSSASTHPFAFLNGARHTAAAGYNSGSRHLRAAPCFQVDMLRHRKAQDWQAFFTWCRHAVHSHPYLLCLSAACAELQGYLREPAKHATPCASQSRECCEKTSCLRQAEMCLTTAPRPNGIQHTSCCSAAAGRQGQQQTDTQVTLKGRFARIIRRLQLVQAGCTCSQRLGRCARLYLV